MAHSQIFQSSYTTIRLATALLILPFLAGAAQASEYEPPRTSQGVPDLGGVWTNASLTSLSRPRNLEKLVLSQEEAEQLAAGHFHNVRAAEDATPSDPNRTAPDKVDRLPPVGNYNAAYVEPGSTYGVVRGEIRTSWIVSPADGQVPFRPELREQMTSSRERRSTYSDPEVLSLGERCLLGFGGTAGPPMLNVLYNNHYRIVQTADDIAIVVEMVHDTRVIRLGRQHGPSTAENGRWLGESVGRWDGDTLVVETTNFHPARAVNGPLYYSSAARVEERFTRVADDSLLYEFSVEDPVNYSEPFRGEMTFRPVDSRVYEYACHEGNYAMPAILKGARMEENETSEQP